MIPKNVVLKLVSISYSGKSIGNDLLIEIKALDQILSTDITLDQGRTAEINKNIGIFSGDEITFALPVKIIITEKDPIFNDVAHKTVRVKVDLSSGGKQMSSHRITIHETRKFSKGTKAVFDLTLEVSFQKAIRYFEEQKDGFLSILISGQKEPESLPAFLKVDFERRENGRDYFRILEGVYMTRKGSVIVKSEENSYLLAGNFHTDSAYITYSKSQKALSVNGKNYKAIEHPSTPWKKGKYDIEIADTAHKGGEGYIDKAPKAKVWFRISHNYKEERYIHTGQRTAGCITLTEHEKWDEVYQVLIRARKGDLKSVGILEVID